MVERHMSVDWMRLDAELALALRNWRRSESALARSADADDSCPIPARLVDEERLPSRDDPLARAFGAWLSALAAERALWKDRVALAKRWHERVPLDGQKPSLRELRGELLRAAHARERQELGAAFAGAVGPLADMATAALERRVERFGLDALIEVDGLEAEQVNALAARWLETTRDLASPWQRRGWVEGLRAALGCEAREGWPARLRARWIDQVFSSSRIAVGLSIELPALPEAWGASSFCLALGAFGAAVLEAGRPPTMPLALHQHPRGIRRHRRFALFAALPAETSFAMRVLDLGRGRALDQSRAVAAALLCSLRVDALRVRLAAALRQGKRAFHDTFAAETEAMFGEPAPAALAGALPLLRPGDAPRFVGALCAAEARDALIAAHDEDWYRSPRAANALREEDAAAATGIEALDGALVLTVDRFESTLG